MKRLFNKPIELNNGTYLCPFDGINFSKIEDCERHLRNTIHCCKTHDKLVGTINLSGECGLPDPETTKPKYCCRRCPTKLFNSL